MQIDEIIKRIEDFAPLQTQEEWDSSGWQILENNKKEINKIMLCLTPSLDIINQAKEQNCDLIIAHHPLFFIPFEFNKKIPIYSAHTNLDKAQGGTTDTLAQTLDLEVTQKIGDFLRIAELKTPINLADLALLIKIKLNLFNLRIVNNKNIQTINKIALCAGSGTEFLRQAKENDADILITGDVKYHTALDSDVIIADIGHFESERPVLNTIKDLLTNDIEVTIADEKSPFINY